MKDSSTESGKLTLQNLPRLPRPHPSHIPRSENPSAGADLVSGVTSSAKAAVKRWKKSRKKGLIPRFRRSERVRTFSRFIIHWSAFHLKSAVFWIYKTEQSINMCSCFLQTHKNAYKLRENSLSKDVLCLFSDRVGGFAACEKTTSCFYTLRCNIWVIGVSAFTVIVGGVPLRGFSSVAKDQHGRLIWQFQSFYRIHRVTFKWIMKIWVTLTLYYSRMLIGQNHLRKKESAEGKIK